MSQDQKPGKMRVVGNGSAAASRRSADVDPVSAAGAPAIAAAATPGAAIPAAKKPVLLLVILFLVGCAAGGFALPLLGAS